MLHGFNATGKIIGQCNNNNDDLKAIWISAGLSVVKGKHLKNINEWKYVSCVLTPRTSQEIEDTEQAIEDALEYTDEVWEAVYELGEEALE